MYNIRKSITGKNLFDINTTPIYTTTATATKIENGIRVTDTASGTYHSVVYKLLDVSNYVGKQFTIKANWLSSGSNNGRITLGLCDENGGNRIAGTSVDTTNTQLTYTIPTITTSKYLAMWLYSNTNGTATNGSYINYTNIMLNEGSTTLPYEPYENPNITIQDGTNTSLVGCNIEGNSYQYTTTGKNLWQNSNYITHPSMGNDLTITDTGFTYTRSTTGGRYIAKTIQVQNGKTYTFSYTKNANPEVDLMLFIYRGGVYQTKLVSTSNNVLSYTSTADETLYFTFIMNSSLQTGTATNIQVEVGSSVTSFEPYTGGTASPNPDYPQEVEVVKGKNLNFTPYKDGSSKITNGVTFSVNTNGEIIANGTSTANAYFYCHTHDATPYWNLPKGNYYLTGCPSGGATNKYYLRLSLYNDTTSVASFTDFGSGVLVNASSYTYNRIMLYVFIANGQSCNNLKFSPMLEKGTSATKYLPYNNIGVNVIGKNLFNWNNPSTITLIKSSARTTSVYPVSSIKLTAGTYTLSLPDLELANNNYALNVELVGVIGGSAFTNKARTFTITETKTLTYLYIFLNSSDNDNATATFSKIQLEKEDTATDFVPYSNITTPIDLQGNFIGKTGSTKDELNIDDLGNVILTKRIGKVVLNGSETYSYTTNYGGYRYKNDDFNINSTNPNENLMCSHFKIAEARGNSSGTIPIIRTYSSTSDTQYIFICDGTNDETTFKNWLQSNNVTVYYQLATPYQVNLGKANIILNNGTNYITFLTGLDSRNTIEYEADTSTFREQSYSGESNYQANLKIYHNNVENTIDMSQIARITIKDPIIDTTSQIFYLGSFIAKSLTIKFKNLDGIEIESGDKVTLEIGQLINDEYIDIPIGEFYIDELAENYQTTCEIVCNDASVKFKQAVDYSSCFVGNKATIDTILQEICRICDVPLGKYPTTNGDIEIGTFNNTISGKQWISYIAELKGCNAKIDRYGRLTLIPLKQSSKVSINALESSSWNLGEKYTISQVRYYNGSIWYESPVNPENTQNVLYIRNDNPFINSNNTLDNIYNVVGQCDIYNVKTTNYGDITLDAYDNITYDLGNDSYQTLNDNTIVYEMSLMTTVENKISTKQQETTTNVVAGDIKAQLRTVSTQVDLVNAKVTQNISDISELQTSTTEIEQSTDSITTRINGMSTSINDLNQQVTQFNETYEERTKNSYTLWFSESGIEGDIETLQNAMNNNSEEITSIKKYIRQVSGNIELGEEGSQMKVVISNDRISFYTGNDESAYISQDKLYITDSTILNKLQVGNWETKEDSNHNLNTKWIG